MYSSLLNVSRYFINLLKDKVKIIIIITNIHNIKIVKTIFFENIDNSNILLYLNLYLS